MMTTPKRILIADDEETFRESTVAILADAGYACNAARDATEAERLLENGLNKNELASLRHLGGDPRRRPTESATPARSPPRRPSTND